MALEVESLESTKCPLTLKILPNNQISSSRSSSLELSSILPTTASSTSSLPALNVKFAPLPQLLPRKRRSTVPLGMAGRGQLIPRRSGNKGQKVPPAWTDEGPEELRLQREELAARDARCNAYAAYVAARNEEDDEDDPDSVYAWHHQRRTKNGEQVDGDPLHALGRIVKVASKTLWKRVSHIDVAAAATSIPNTNVDSKGQEDSKTGSPTLIKPCPPPTLRPILGSITSNLTSNVDDHHAEEDGVIWEEDIRNSFPLDISQTDTMIEGRAVYSRSTSKVVVVSRSPPPSPSVSNYRKVLKKFPSTKMVSPPFKVKQGS